MNKFGKGLCSLPRAKAWMGVIGIAVLLTGCSPDLAAGSAAPSVGTQAQLEPETPTKDSRQRGGAHDSLEDEATALASLALGKESEENVYVQMSGQWLEQHMFLGLTQGADDRIPVAENVSAILALQSLGYYETAFNAATHLRDPEQLDALIGQPQAIRVGEAAQIIVALEAVGSSVVNTGERDLLAELGDAMAGTWGASTVTSLDQAWAIIALAYSGQPDWTGIERFSMAQCDDGGFPNHFDAAEQCTGDVRVTARVLSGLTLSLNGSPNYDSAPYQPIVKDATEFLHHAAQKSVDGTVFWVNPKTKSPSLELTSAATIALADASDINPGTAVFLFNRLASATDGGAVTVNGKPSVAATAQTLLGLSAAGLSQF